MKERYIAFVAGISQLRILQTRSDLWPRSLPATHDFQVGEELCRMGKTWVNLWDYLPDRLIEANINATWEILSTWPSQQLKDIVFNEIPLAECMENEMYFAFVSILNIYQAAKKILTEFSAMEAISFREMERALFWNPQDGPYPDLFNAAVAYALQESGINSISLSIGKGEEGSIAGMLKKLIHIDNWKTGSIFKRMEWNKARLLEQQAGLKLLRKWLDEGEDRKKRIIGVGGYIGYVEMGPFLKDVREKDGYEVLFLRRSAFPSEWDKIIPVLDFQIFLKLPYNLESIQRQCRIARDKFNIVSPAIFERYDVLFQNPFLFFQFRRFWERLINGARWIAAVDLIARAVQPDLVFTGYDREGYMRCLTRSFKVNQVPVISISHGGIGHPEDYRFMHGDPDQRWIFGELEKRGLARLHGKKISTVIVGSFRTDLDNQPTIKSGFEGEEGDTGPGNNIPGTTILVLATSIGYGLAYPKVNLSGHITSWGYIETLARQRDDLHFQIRAHPRYDFFQLYERLAGFPECNITLSRGRSLAEDVNEADIVLLVSNATTAAVEAIRQRKPIIYLCPALSTIPGFEPSIKREGGGIILLEDCKLEAEIDKLIRDKTYRDSVVKAGVKYLRKLLSYTGRDALDTGRFELGNFINSHQSEPIIGQSSNAAGEILAIMVTIMTMAQSYSGKIAFRPRNNPREVVSPTGIFKREEVLLGESIINFAAIIYPGGNVINYFKRSKSALPRNFRPSGLFVLRKIMSVYAMKATSLLHS